MRTLSTWSLFVAAWLWCAGALAQQSTTPAPAPDEEAGLPAGYKDAFLRAAAEFDLGHYAEARSVFEQAHELFPNARTLRGLGMVEFELRNYIASIELLDASLISTARPLSERQRAEVEQLLARARDFVAPYQLQLSPSRAQVRLDGVPVQLDASGTLVIEVGEHTLEVRAPGHVTERRGLSVAGRGPQRLRIELRQIPPPAEAQTPLRRKWWVWTTVGLVVAGSAIAVALATRPDSSSEPTSIDTVVGP